MNALDIRNFISSMEVLCSEIKVRIGVFRKADDKLIRSWYFIHAICYCNSG